jgi:hypothetical protein
MKSELEPVIEEELGMETRKKPSEQGSDGGSERLGYEPTAAEVVTLVGMRQTEAGSDVKKRDWSGTLDLINETYQAIRMADERASAAEEYSRQLTKHFQDQLRAVESRLAATESRALAAESRAKEAEEWLVRFHDAIMEGFGKSVTLDRQR